MHTRAHAHTRYLWLCFHLCWHGWKFTTALKNLQVVPQKFHILLSCVIMAHLSGSQMLCQPHNWFTATSVRIFEEEEETNVRFWIQCFKETNGGGRFTKRKHRKNPTCLNGYMLNVIKGGGGGEKEKKKVHYLSDRRITTAFPGMF